MMVDTIDPARQIGVVRGYSYRQMFTRPFIGGGFISALGSAHCRVGPADLHGPGLLVTVGMTIWGMKGRVGSAM